MIETKPAIYIYTTQANIEFLQEIKAGIEEEGVLYQEFEKEHNSTAEKSAYEAAKNSTLGVGIGIRGTTAVLQLEKLPKDTPLFKISNLKEFRTLGTNAARAVKKQAFKM